MKKFTVIVFLSFCVILCGCATENIDNDKIYELETQISQQSQNISQLEDNIAQQNEVILYMQDLDSQLSARIDELENFLFWVTGHKEMTLKGNEVNILRYQPVKSGHFQIYGNAYRIDDESPLNIGGYFNLRLFNADYELLSTSNNTARIFFHFEQGKTYYISISNQLNDEIKFDLNINEIEEITTDRKITISGEQIFFFTNNQEMGKKFIFELEGSYSTLAESFVYNQNNQPIANRVQSSTTSKQLFGIGAGETCYIYCQLTGETITGTLQYNQNQFKYAINGEPIDCLQAELNFGQYYDIGLLLYDENDIVIGNLNDYITFNCTGNVEIEYDDALYHLVKNDSQTVNGIILIYPVKQYVDTSFITDFSGWELVISVVE